MINSQNKPLAAISSVRLRPSIVGLFVILVVPIFTAMLWFTYTTNDSMTRSNAKDLMERFRFEATTNTQNLLNPIANMVTTAATLGSKQPQFYRDDQSWDYLKDILSYNETTSSVFVGFEDGTFRQLMRTDASTRIQNQAVPKESALAYRWIDRSAKQSGIDAYTLKNLEGNVVGDIQLAATYDPRQRDWYKGAAINKEVMIAAPYVFASTGLPGITVAAPFYAEGRIMGVVAADITLDNLSKFLAERLVSPRSLSLIVDDQDKVIAYSNLKEPSKRTNGKIDLKHIGALDNDLPALAMIQQSKAENKDNFTFVHPNTGEEYAASFSSFASDRSKRWQVLIVAPLDDFAGPLKENNKRLLIFGSLAIVLQVLFIYFLSRLIAKPLERLEKKVNDVRELVDVKQADVIQSPIREIASLSRAVDTLDHAVRSFAAFVPIALVRHLIESDKQLELGGKSRFLTMMFCDVEAFSTLAENSPSQDLLERISAYLEVVTLAVNEEQGTIDKFIGDAAMAFWGAPAELPDHTWHACAAAIRIRDKMSALNQKWQAQGLDPLQIRIGIHCDSVMVGNIGSKHRMSYTVMGDAVNVTSRLEGVNKDYGTQICVSQAIFREVGERLVLRPIDVVTVKGRRNNLEIYELLDVIDSDQPIAESTSTQDVKEQCRITKLAYLAYTNKNWPEAIRLYQALLDTNPDDHLAANMLQRCALLNK